MSYVSCCLRSGGRGGGVWTGDEQVKVTVYLIIHLSPMCPGFNQGYGFLGEEAAEVG